MSTEKFWAFVDLLIILPVGHTLSDSTTAFRTGLWIIWILYVLNYACTSYLKWKKETKRNRNRSKILYLLICILIVIERWFDHRFNSVNVYVLEKPTTVYAQSRALQYAYISISSKRMHQRKVIYRHRAATPTMLLLSLYLLLNN